jgi:Ni/Fe-hydrogenase 1 B-type cytochrome subunit
MSEIMRVLIWSGWLRLSHWALALSTLVLMTTGWLIAHSPMVADIALEYHYMAVAVLIFGLILRILIFFRGQPHERLSALFPEVSEIRSIKRTLLFYFSLARQPMPHWYAHNPLWKILYVLFYVVLLLLLFSGALMEEYPVVFGFYLPSVHAFWAKIVSLFVLLHLLTLFIHDYYANTTDVSAMINGYRLFEVTDSGKLGSGLKTVPVAMQPLDTLLGKHRNDRNDSND